MLIYICIHIFEGPRRRWRQQGRRDRNIRTSVYLYQNSTSYWVVEWFIDSWRRQDMKREQDRWKEVRLEGGKLVVCMIWVCVCTWASTCVHVAVLCLRLFVSVYVCVYLFLSLSVPHELSTHIHMWAVTQLYVSSLLRCTIRVVIHTCGMVHVCSNMTHSCLWSDTRIGTLDLKKAYHHSGPSLWGWTNFRPAQTQELPGHKPLVVIIVDVGPFKKEEERICIASNGASCKWRGSSWGIWAERWIKCCYQHRCSWSPSTCENSLSAAWCGWW